MNTLHYIFDPLCGWCYAAAPLIEAAREVRGLKLALHGGGMLTGPNRRAITPQWRDYVMPHDRRIAELTGQPFGEAYFEGLLRDTSAVMDSAPPTTAILVAEEIAGRGLEMAHRVQRAHYLEGRRIAEPEVLIALAIELGLDATAFTAAWRRLEGPATAAHIRDSRAWLARAGGQGFPTLALEADDGTLTRIEPGEWLGRPAAFAAALRERVPASPDEAPGAIPHCGLDGCKL
ncbi:DsbA family protein [Uliginosibacterium sp. 31-16]|uniref:DsbA family protein n=1 Tax=Uliginosibacterium sp. 31-16 TaxID=3068315 RepID=UPI00273DE578|nr:DsbA family protein [Uliginosibacterium sp. 31-16]MDP5238748.1 DsbA family protein [Uliginosibacterium sp. 31-16]